ncbi:MAG: 4-(cytidine 5'-diphospho)-2-C-methyl-D-erythritol kinase [Hyphomicrobiaceae bacterium]
MQVRETARAKVNLTLRVLGRRPDGYHDIESLVTFAEVGDCVTLHPGAEIGVTVGGPFARDIEGANLLERALELLREVDGELTLGVVALEKNLPVAAGLGGGSADAAALLRAVRRANPERATRVPWYDIARRLGADVPVCLAGVPATMRGIGDHLAPLAGRSGGASLPAVLANPRRLLPTARVFGALASRRMPDAAKVPLPDRAFGDRPSLLAHVRATGNDLEAPAVALLPVIAEVKAALAGQPGCLAAAMSGSGPTCFGLFEDKASATRAAAALASRQSGWWVAATSCDWPA